MISNPALAVVSAAILAYEVLLVRLFAIVQWHHFAYLAISIALLGFGVSGALLALFRHRLEPRAPHVFALSAVLFAVTAPVAFWLSQALPFNAPEVIWAPAQLLYLGVIYLLLAVPFTAGATCIGLAFVKAGTAPGKVYFWNLLGSGVGALGMVAALGVLSPMACLMAIAILGLAAAAVGAFSRGNRRGLVAVGAVAAIGSAAWLLAPPSWTALRISEFKGLTRALAIQDARLTAERSGPLALVSVVESPTVPFRYAPGLSLRAPDLPPPQLGLFLDGEFAGAIDIRDGVSEGSGYLDRSADALIYHLARDPDVLVLGAGGARPVLQAAEHGAKRIDAVERNPDLIGVVRSEPRVVPVFDRPGVKVRTADPRRFVTAATDTWDVIVLPFLESGGVAGGLNESFISTVEAVRAVYRRLDPGGWLSVTGWLDLPPRATPEACCDRPVRPGAGRNRRPGVAPGPDPQHDDGDAACQKRPGVGSGQGPDQDLRRVARLRPDPLSRHGGRRGKPAEPVDGSRVLRDRPGAARSRARRFCFGLQVRHRTGDRRPALFP